MKGFGISTNVIWSSSLPLGRHWKGKSTVATVAVPSQTVLAQKGMHISVLCAAIMPQDITMVFGRVKAVKHSSKEAFKVGGYWFSWQDFSRESEHFCRQIIRFSQFSFCSSANQGQDNRTIELEGTDKVIQSNPLLVSWSSPTAMVTNLPNQVGNHCHLQDVPDLWIPLSQW